MEAAAIIYFDGVCGLCNRFVDFVLRFDKSGRIRFAPLQGEYARAHLPAELVTTGEFSTVVVQTQEAFYVQYRAVRVALREMGGWWRPLSYLMALFPGRLGDIAYRWVAAHRYQWFGRKDSCRLPTAAERARFYT